MSKTKQKCLQCEDKLKCLGSNTCIWDARKLWTLQRILDRLAESLFWNRGEQKVLFRSIVAYYKFDQGFRGSRKQRRADAILFIKKYYNRIERWSVNQNRTAFILQKDFYRR